MPQQSRTESCLQSPDGSTPSSPSPARAQPAATTAHWRCPPPAGFVALGGAASPLGPGGRPQDRCLRSMRVQRAAAAARWGRGRRSRRPAAWSDCACGPRPARTAHVPRPVDRRRGKQRRAVTRRPLPAAVLPGDRQAHRVNDDGTDRAPLVSHPQPDQLHRARIPGSRRRPPRQAPGGPPAAAVKPRPHAAKNSRSSSTASPPTDTRPSSRGSTVAGLPSAPTRASRAHRQLVPCPQLGQRQLQPGPSRADTLTCRPHPPGRRGAGPGAQVSRSSRCVDGH